jgi:hypothetical protein
MYSHVGLVEMRGVIYPEVIILTSVRSRLESSILDNLVLTQNTPAFDAEDHARSI